MVPIIWPAFDQAKPHAFYVGMAQCFNCWVSFGVQNPFAIGMTTQADAEARFITTAVGDKGTAFGLYQEHKDRADRIKLQTGIDLLAVPPPSILDQCRAAWWELNNTEKKARDAMMLAITGGGAAAIGCSMFERAGAPDAVARRTLEGERITVFVSRNLDWVRAQKL